MNLHLPAAIGVSVLALAALGWAGGQWLGGPVATTGAGLTPAADDLQVHGAETVLRPLRPELLTADAGNPFGPPLPRDARGTKIPLPPPPPTAFPDLPILPAAETR